ncbi:MAG: 50S ribosomal protein L1 [Armatimonadetes bacterium]|nr:50S ribosomal protein L1 [Armatimonadota bacterium]
MPARTKRYQEAVAQVDRERVYDPVEALELVKKAANVKFDETVDLAVKLGVDPRHGDQMVRGVTPLPHGTGKKRRVAVFARGEAAREAEEAGADAVGAEELVARIQAGADKEFDVFLATPDVMSIVGRLGRILTQRMPNPKAGTVTPDIGRAVREVKTGGRVEFKVEKAGIVHMPIGKTSYEVEQLRQNFAAAIGAILKARPAAAKGHYLQQIVVSSTMGPGIRIDTAAAARIAEK